MVRTININPKTLYMISKNPQPISKMRRVLVTKKPGEIANTVLPSEYEA